MSKPEFHRKCLDIEDADYEIRQLEFADDIDPDQKYHIGNPTMEGIWNAKMTLRFKYGGLAISNLHNESTDIIMSVLCNFKNILKGVKELNQHGLFHRDIKTSNILYDHENIPRLIDFGIASIRIMDEIFENIYPIWPFETILLSTTDVDVFSDDVYGSYVNDTFLKPILHYLKIDTSDIKVNASRLKKLNVTERLDTIYCKIDVYSLGIVFSYFLMKNKIKLSMSTSQHDKLYSLCKKMINPYTSDRIKIDDVILEYEKIF